MKLFSLFIGLLICNQLNAQNIDFQWLRDSVLSPAHKAFSDTILKRNQRINNHAVFHYSILRNEVDNDTMRVICNYMLNESDIDYYYKNYYFFNNQDTLVVYLEGIEKKMNLDAIGLYSWNEKIKYLLKDHLFPTDLGAYTYSSKALVITLVKGKPKEYKVYDRMEWVPQAGRVFRFGR
jgi:hypothetical protein